MKPTKQTERLLLAACLTEDDRRMASEWLEIYSPGSDSGAEDLAHLARRARWATERRIAYRVLGSAALDGGFAADACKQAELLGEVFAVLRCVGVVLESLEDSRAVCRDMLAPLLGRLSEQLERAEVRT